MSLLSVAPLDVEVVRRRLFALEEPIEMPWAQFIAYWPYADNFWSWNAGVRWIDMLATPPYASATAHFRCRFHAKKDHQPDRAAAPLRHKTSRNALACPARMSVVKKGEVVSVRRAARTPHPHNHEMEVADALKRNGAVRSMAKQEIEKGYRPCLVRRNIAGRDEATIADATAAGARHLNAFDVHNAGKAFRRQYPDTRLGGALEDWEQQRLETLRWLQEQGWWATSIKVSFFSTLQCH